MSHSGIVSRVTTILRWTARVWSVLLAFVVLMSVVAGLHIVQPLTDMVELVFYGLALLGLLLAWRWEGLGGLLALAGLAGNALAFRFIRGACPFLNPLVFLFGIPALLYLACSELSPGRSEAAARAEG